MQRNAEGTRIFLQVENGGGGTCRSHMTRESFNFKLFFHSHPRLHTAPYSLTCKFIFYLVCFFSLLTLFSKCPCVLPWRCWTPLSSPQLCKSVFCLLFVIFPLLTLISELERPSLSPSPVPSPHPLRCPLPG